MFKVINPKRPTMSEIVKATETGATIDNGADLLSDHSEESGRGSPKMSRHGSGTTSPANMAMFSTGLMKNQVLLRMKDVKN